MLCHLLYGVLERGGNILVPLGDGLARPPRGAGNITVNAVYANDSFGQENYTVGTRFFILRGELMQGISALAPHRC